MRQPSNAADKGWAESTIIGVAPAGAEISTRPFELVTGRVWWGTVFGGAKGRTDVPKIVELYMEGKINIDVLITHHQARSDKISHGFDLMHAGKSIRSVVIYLIARGWAAVGRTHEAAMAEGLTTSSSIAATAASRASTGTNRARRGARWSLRSTSRPRRRTARCRCSTWLSGRPAPGRNFTEKAGVQRHAAARGLIIVAPDTSPRGTDFPGEHDRYDFGSGAGFYVDATKEPRARHYGCTAT